jgi:glycerophosphoryl diester phosphodiesterase
MTIRLIPVLLLFSCSTIFGQHHAFVASDSSLQSFFANNKLVSAHRGGPTSDHYPENCLETFDHLISAMPAVLEFDVEMSLDSVLFLLHDNTLDRTTSGSGSVKTTAWSNLSSLRLKTKDGNTTPYTIPSFEQTLQWIKARNAIVTVDVKRYVPYERVVRMIEQHQLMRQAVVITYNVNDARLVHELNQELLISASIRNVESLDLHLQAGIPPANLLAFVGTREPDPALYAALKARGIPAILGTMGNLDQMAATKNEVPYQSFLQNGADVLATDRPLEAYRAIRQD